MTKTEYQLARRLVRTAGLRAVRWLPSRIEKPVTCLLSAPADQLAERAAFYNFCKRVGARVYFHI